MCRQLFSGINFTKYDYNQYILELNKIKVFESKNKHKGLSRITKIG